MWNEVCDGSIGIPVDARWHIGLQSIYHVTTPVFTFAGGRIYNSMCPLVVGGHPKYMDIDKQPYAGYMDQVGIEGAKRLLLI